MYELIDKYKETLIKDIGKKRYEHCVRVMETAKKMAGAYGVNEQKALVAGLLHDCGRYIDEKLLLQKSKQYNILSSNSFENSKELLHANLGAYLAKHKYGIDDEDILNAIKYHTTGRENMSNLEKIIFLADYIEPNRVFEGVKEIRELCYEDLDIAMLKSLTNNILHIINNNRYLDIRTARARNYFLTKNIDLQY
ncbi:bis(5'-nucleosyl)-tetraphosphatase (symmetrical) YqeK [Clostridiaceae bacterium M8S5]|nr:bis(5'-nucleosyl)-tetraphosphatase (symmetrical) YqeK [Clostridiaceae bacterium M8S5]